MNFPTSGFGRRCLQGALAGPAFAIILLAELSPGTVRSELAANAANASFPAGKTVLWLGHTQVITLHLAAPAQSDGTFTATADDPWLVEIVRPPAFLAGEQTAYVRVRALQEGRTRLELFGGPGLDVEVKADPTEPIWASIGGETRRPRIESPMQDAVVWGDFGVSVTIFDRGTPADTKPLKVQLRLPDGHLLDSIGETSPEQGPERRFQFIVPATNLPAGRLSLVAVAGREGSVEPGRTTSAFQQESAPFSVCLLPSPPSGSLWAGECESETAFGVTKQLYAPARPAKFGNSQPQVVVDPAASGGKMVKNPGNGWCLPFVVKKSGDYQLMIRTRGDYGGGGSPVLSLIVNDAPEPSGMVRLAGAKYCRTPIGSVLHLEAGPQILSLVFKNTYGRARENRNVYLDNYELARIGETAAPAAAASTAKSPGAPSPVVGLHSPAPLAVEPPLTAGVSATAAPPKVSVVYPADHAAVFGADAVIARAVGGTAILDTADILLDGQLQHVARRNPAQAEMLVFPLLLRELTPGEHRLAVRFSLAGGAFVDTPELTINVLLHPPAARGPYDRAVRLLDRFAFGPEPRELANLLTLGESKWLATRLLEPYSNPAEQAVLQAAARRYRELDSRGSVINRALDDWIHTDNPVRARFTAWAENHFSTWMVKVNGDLKWDEHLTFSKLGVAPFYDLLQASAHSPAMLTYLDQEKSLAGNLNENYAREIMELHTLGVHGGYVQADVTALANVLNGWTLVEQAELPEVGNDALPLIDRRRGERAGLVKAFGFVPALNDGRPRRVLGLQFPAADSPGRYDRIQLALEMLASHPSTAEHVCRKLAEHYVGTPAPDPLVHRLAATFQESGGDMRAVMFSMLGAPEFWNAGPKVATPLDYGLRNARLCRAAALEGGGSEDQALSAEAIQGFLKHSSMGLFDRVTPDGYPEDSGAYADSNALLQRWRFMQGQSGPLSRLVPAAWRTPPTAATPPDPNNSAGAATAPEGDPAQRFIDLAAIRLTGRLLTPASNEAALQVLGEGRPDDLQQTLIFVSLLPETSLR